MTENEFPEEDVYYYTELATKEIYEVKFFQGFVLARPPLDYRKIRKIDIKTFGKEFELYAGDQSTVAETVFSMDDVIGVC